MLWIIITIHVSAVAFLGWGIREEMELVSAISLMLGYAILVITLTIIFITKLPFTKSIFTHPATKFLGYTLPVFIVYLSKGYAAAWIGELFDISPANLPFAYTTATTFVSALALILLLLALSLVFELLMFFAGVLPRTITGNTSKITALMILAGAYFIAFHTTASVLMQLSGGALGRLMITAVAFRFDSSPAIFCDITNDEAVASQGGDPKIIAIPLSPNQDRAILYQSPEALLQPISIYKFNKEKATNIKWPKAIRVVECFKPNQKRADPDTEATP